MYSKYFKYIREPFYVITWNGGENNRIVERNGTNPVSITVG